MSDVDTPAFRPPAYTAACPTWKQCRDALAGTRAIRAAGDEYLPRFDGEGEKVYAMRRDGAVFFNGFARTGQAMTGLATQDPPKLGEDVPALVVTQAEHLDRQQRSLTAFLVYALKQLIAMGCGGIFVDAPLLADPDLAPANQDEVEQRGIRPYWIWCAPEDVTYLDWDLVGFDLRVSHLVRRSCDQVSTGRFGFTEEEVYYEYTVDATGVVSWFKWEWQEKQYTNAKGNARAARKDEPTEELAITGTGTMPRVLGIPFSPCAVGKGDDPFYRVSPLLDLLDINLRHYQTDAALHWNLHMQGYGITVRIGAAVNDSGVPIAGVALGPTVLVDVPLGGDLKIVAPPADAFAHQQQSLLDDEARMGAIGLAFLRPSSQGVMTDESRRLDLQAGHATLRSILDEFKDCVEGALAFHAQMLGLADAEGDGGSLTFSFSAGDQLLDPLILNALSAMQKNGQLTLRTLLRTVELGRLPDDFDPEQEELELQLAPPVPASTFLPLFPTDPNGPAPRAIASPAGAPVSITPGGIAPPADPAKAGSGSQA